MPQTTTSGAQSAPCRPTHSFIVPLNDLEALTIVRLVEAVKEGRGDHDIRPDVHVLRHGWGARAAITDDVIKGLAPVVILVEIPDEAMIRRLEARGHTVVVVDHHIYANGPGAVTDRRSALSSLEQVMLLLGVRVSDLPESLRADVPLVAANDRGFIPRLAEAARTLAEAAAERRGEDLKDPSTQATIAKAVKESVRNTRCRDLTIARLAADKARPDVLAVVKDDATWAAEMQATENRIGEAREALRAAFSDSKARWLDLDGVPYPDAEPRLLLAWVPERFRHIMADAVYADMSGSGSPNPTGFLDMLLVFHAGSEDTTAEVAPGAITRVEFSGGVGRLEQVGQWFDPAVRTAWPSHIGRLTCFAGGGDSAYFGAADPLGGHGAALSDLVECLLGDLLTGNRPVAAWRTSFVQALAVGDPLDAKDAGDDDRDANGTVAAPPKAGTLKVRILAHLDALRHKASQGRCRPQPIDVGDEEWHYFLPHLRDLLVWRPKAANTTDAAWTEAKEAIETGRAMVSLALPCAGLSLSVHRKGYQGAVTLPITALRLHFLYNDVLLVEWTVEETGPRIVKQGQGEGSRKTNEVFWPDLLDSRHPAIQRPLGQVVELNGKLRFTHSAMASEAGEQGRPTTVTLFRDGHEPETLRHGAGISDSPFTGWYRALLIEALGLGPEDFAPDGAPKPGVAQVRALFDDRARVITSVVPVGRRPETDAGRNAFDVMLARLTTVDPYDTGHTCDSAFALKEYRGACYNRYRAWGTQYMAMAHSVVFVGMDNNVTRDLIHLEHMATLYRRMALVAQGYLAILGAFSLAVTDALTLAQDREEALTRFYDVLHRGQLEFTNHIWFMRISSQVQAAELFDLMSRQTGCAAEYQLVRDEIQQMQAFLSAAADARKVEQVTEEERRDRTIAAIALPFVLVFAVLGSQQIAGHFVLWPMLEALTQGLSMPVAYTWVPATALALVAAGVMALAVNPELFRSWPWIGKTLHTVKARRAWRRRARAFLAVGAALVFALGLALQSSGGIVLSGTSETPAGASSGAAPED